MTTKEEKVINDLLQSVRDMREENRTFRNDISTIVTDYTKKVDGKHLPITLEQDILHSAQAAISDSIKAVLSGYNSPLSKLIQEVVAGSNAELREIISTSFNQVIKKDEFKQSIVSAFSHKVSRAIISNNDGLFDKVSNELKQDAVFKSKMALAVSNVVEEVLSERQSQ